VPVSSTDWPDWVFFFFAPILFHLALLPKTHPAKDSKPPHTKASYILHECPPPPPRGPLPSCCFLPKAGRSLPPPILSHYAKRAAQAFLFVEANLFPPNSNPPFSPRRRFKISHFPHLRDQVLFLPVLLLYRSLFLPVNSFN